MNCTSCDAPLPPGATFCANCGARVARPSAGGSPTISLPAVDVPENPPPPTSVGAPTMVIPAADAPGSAAPQPPYTPQPSYTPIAADQPTYAQPQSYAQPSYTPIAAAQPAFPPATLPTSSSATVSLIFGILSWVILPVIGAIVAIIAGHMARREIQASNGQLGGSGLATAGLVLGYAHIAVAALACVGFVLLVGIGAMSSR